jgi:hypothetical protein
MHSNTQSPGPAGQPLEPTVFAVVGEHRTDPDRLLLLGDDGRFYTYETGVPTAVELTPDWIVDTAA